MLNPLKTAALAAGLLVAPIAASAATMVAPGGSYDLLADNYLFDGVFNLGDAGDSYTFSFTNASNSRAALAVVGATVQQVSAAFLGGVSLDIGPLAFDFAQDETAGEEGEFIVGAGQTVDLVLSFGKVIDTGRAKGGTADIDFAIEAAVVPVPAAGLLLLTAMGGLALARRRKSAA